MRKEFDKALVGVAKPALEKYGYAFDGKRRFFKTMPGGKDVFIEYQVGTRAAQGTFTVNLVAGDTSERLSCVKPTLLGSIVNKLMGSHNPWWKGLFLPKDRWWSISAFQKEMDSIVTGTIRDLEAYGIAWLERVDQATE